MRSFLRFRFGWAAVCLGLSCSVPSAADADVDEDRLILQDPAAAAPVATAVDAPIDHRLALGVSYLGGQARWNLLKKWAVEFQFQSGKASSDYGDVTAKVFGLRAYRFFKKRNRIVLYVGPEMAYATAKSSASDYQTSGPVAGVFGGFDYYFAKRFSLGMDVGPYLISLKEKQTGLSQTNLDFVVNTTLNWHLL